MLKRLYKYTVIFLGAIVVFRSFQIGSAIVISNQIQETQVTCNIKPTDNLITPQKAALIALQAILSFNVQEIHLILDTYPLKKITRPTYSVEITMKPFFHEFEGEVVSIKVDAETGKIVDIAYGVYNITPV